MRIQKLNDGQNTDNLYEFNEPLSKPIHPSSITIIILQIIFYSYSNTDQILRTCCSSIILSSMLLYNVLHLLQVVEIDD